MKNEISPSLFVLAAVLLLLPAQAAVPASPQNDPAAVLLLPPAQDGGPGVPQGAPAGRESRAVWVHAGMFSGSREEARKKLLHTLDLYAGIDVTGLYVFNSLPEQNGFDWDFLGVLAKEAHARRMGVHPVICPGHKLRPADPALDHPEWLIHDRGGEILPHLNPACPEARAYVLKKVSRALAYDIDGIHLDYIRFPVGQCFSYDAATCAAFKKEYGHSPLEVVPDIGSITWCEWIRWNAKQVTRLVREIRALLEASGRNLRLSAAVFPDPGSARVMIGQDWAFWAGEGLVDALCPMLYVNDAAIFRAYAARAVKAAGGRCEIHAGIALESSHNTNTPEGAAREVEIAREAGASGVVFFSGYSLDAAIIAHLKSTVFARGEPDPSFDSLCNLHPPLQRPREVIGVKDGPEEFAVLPDGTLQAGGREAFFEIGDPPLRFGAGPEGCRKRLAAGGLPVVIAENESRGTGYELTAFGWSEGMKAEKPLRAFLRLRAVASGGPDREIPVALVVADRSEKNPAAPVKTLATLAATAGKGGGLCFELPFAGPDPRPVAVSKKTFDRRLEETVSSWKALLGKGMRIATPEERVNDACRAWLAYNFINVDLKNGIFEPHDGGGGFYEAVYGYSAALYCHALDLFGFHEEAAAYLASLESFVSPEGLFVRNFGLPDTGALLFAMAEHYNLTGDSEWLKEAAPVMIRMCRWIRAKRAESTAARKKGSPVYGLIPYRPYADDPKAAYSYMTDTYLCTGMEHAARVLAAAGPAEDAKWIARESRAYREDILSSMRRAAVERDGAKILPIYPESLELLKKVSCSARDYYSLIASCVLETGFLPPRSEPALWITEHLEKREGLRLSMCRFDAWGGEGIDHAYTYGYWLNALRNGRIRPVLLGFYGSLAYGMSRGTYSAVEVTRITSGENAPTLPHLYSNTQQLRLLRDMLVLEDGEDLLIGGAIPRPWLKAGRSVKVEEAPTAFGQVSFTIAPEAGAGRIRIRIDPPRRNPPERIRIRLRHPEGGEIRRAVLSGGGRAGFTKDTVILHGLAAPAEIEVSYR